MSENLAARLVPNKLRRAISTVLPCVEKYGYAGRFALECILFEMNDDQLTLVAADGFKLGITRLKSEGLLFPSGKWLIHWKEARELRDTLRSAREVNLRVAKGNLLFRIVFNKEEKTITISEKEYTYINWEQLVPYSFTTEAAFQAKLMKKALEQVKTKDWPIIRMYIEEGQIKIVSGEPEGEKKEIVIEAKVKGEPNKQAFQRGHLQQMVNALGGEITFKTSHSSGPGLFESGATKWVIMPIFVQW